MTDIVKDVEQLASAGIDMRTRLILWLGAAVVLLVIGIGLAHHFEERGRTLERAGWLQKQSDWQAKTAQLVLDNEAENAAKVAANQAKERKVSEDHQKELDHLVAERDAARHRADAAGGLRIPAPACPGTAAPSTEAAGASGRDEAGPTTVALPQPLQDSLWALVNQADEVGAQLRACQSWIRSNGFYGNEPADSGPLLDRMIAAPNPPTEATP